MPFIRSLISKRHTYIVAVILLLSKIMPIYFRYILKGLVYIIIAFLFSCQPSFYTKYIKLNICLSYNIRYILILSICVLYVLIFYKVYNFFI